MTPAECPDCHGVGFYSGPDENGEEMQVQCRRCFLAPAAPLEKAVEESRKALKHHRTEVGCHCVGCSLVALLAALDADPWLTQYQEAKSDADRRLEKAEAALREIEKAEGLWADDAAQFQRNRIDNMQAIARRYFAEKGER